MDLQGPEKFPISYILSLIIFSDSRDPIFNSRDPNRFPKTPLKNIFNLNMRHAPGD